MTPRQLAQIAGPVVIVVAAWLVLGVVPDRAGAAQDRIDAAETEAAMLSVQFSAARDAAAARAELVEQQTGAGTAGPADLDMGSFVSAVDGWADDAGIVIEHLSPTPATAATAAAPLPADTSAVAVTLGARGGYEGLMGFVDSLIAADRIVVVDRIELRADEESADVLLDLDIRIFTTDRLVESTTGDPDAATADALDAGVVGQLDGADLTGEGP